MHLAQLNIGTTKYLMDAPEMADFANNLDRINGIAEKTDGFVWRLQDDSGNATGIHVFDDPHQLVNLSVWSSIDALKQFMFQTQHKDFMARRNEWFQPLKEHTYVLWWVEEGHIPSIDEALQKLDWLRKHGESVEAFTFRKTFLPE